MVWRKLTKSHKWIPSAHSLHGCLVLFLVFTTITWLTITSDLPDTEKGYWLNRLISRRRRLCQPSPFRTHMLIKLFRFHLNAKTLECQQEILNRAFHLLINYVFIFSATRQRISSTDMLFPSDHSIAQKGNSCSFGECGIAIYFFRFISVSPGSTTK